MEVGESRIDCRSKDGQIRQDTILPKLCCRQISSAIYIDMHCSHCIGFYATFMVEEVALTYFAIHFWLLTRPHEALSVFTSEWQHGHTSHHYQCYDLRALLLTIKIGAAVVQLREWEREETCWSGSVAVTAHCCMTTWHISADLVNGNYHLDKTRYLWVIYHRPIAI